MPIVTISDFVGEVAIAQVEQPNVASIVNSYIAQYEAEYFNKVLGPVLLPLYTSGIAQNLPSSILLRDGGIYVNAYNVSVQIEGLKKGAINYIYYHYIRDTNTFTTGGGEKKTDPPKALSPMFKLVRAWNRMSEISRNIRVITNYKTDDYGPANWVFNEVFKDINQLGI